MPEPDANVDITELLRRIQTGDAEATRELLPEIYEDLRRIARARLRGEHAETLNTTGLVHEAWLSMAENRRARFGDRRRYFGYVSQVMRHLLTDRARNRAAAKRQLPLADEVMPAAPDNDIWLALDQGIGKIAELNPRIAQVAELQLYVGLSCEEIGELLELGRRTVERDWSKARMLLGQWIGDDRLD